MAASSKKNENGRKWYVINAENRILGRLATRVASILRGKEKPTFAPNMDTGDYVIVVNAAKVKVTGSKADQKTYFRHSRYPGGGKERGFKEQLEKDPTKIIVNAVKGMIPKNKLGSHVRKKLFVYRGAEHKHQAQKPEALEI